MACNINTLLSNAAANGFFSLDDRELRLCVLQLLCSSFSGAGVPTGVIAMFSGSIATIPSGWQLCDGTGGTPDLRDKFVVGARQDQGGVAKTNLTGALTQTGGSITHNHAVTDPGHTHTVNPGTIDNRFLAAGVDIADAAGAGNYQTALGSNGVTNAGTGSKVTGVTVNNQSAPQPYWALAFIMKL